MHRPPDPPMGCRLAAFFLVVFWQPFGSGAVSSSRSTSTACMRDLQGSICPTPVFHHRNLLYLKVPTVHKSVCIMVLHTAVIIAPDWRHLHNCELGHDNVRAYEGNLGLNSDLSRIVRHVCLPDWIGNP